MDSSRNDSLNDYINSGFNVSTECELRPDMLGRSPNVSFKALRLGEVDFLRCEGNGERVSRRALAHIRHNPADHIIVTVTRLSLTSVRHCGLSAQSRPGGFMCLTTLKPWMSHTVPNDGWFAISMVKIPASLLRKEVPHIDECCGRFIDGQNGVGKIMINLFRDAVEEGERLNGSQAGRFGQLLVGAVANALIDAPELEAAHISKPISSHDRVFDEAVTFITANLCSSDLTSQLIAARCRVSVRYLEMSFAANGLTVGTYVKDARLRNCHADLLDNRLRGKTITQICLRWGFNDPAHFSRAYRDKFGRSPKCDRMEASLILKH